MHRSWALVVVAGCSFQPGAFPVRDAPGGDSADVLVTTDAAVDTMNSDGNPPVPIMLVQNGVTTSFGNNSSVSRTFSSDQTAGNLNVVVISWGDNNDDVATVSDSRGNTYTAASGKSSNTSFTQRIYYAANIQAGANTVTVTTTSNTPDPKLRIFEYAGLATTSPVDNNASTSGSGFTMQAGPVTTTQPHELLFAAVVCGSVAGPALDYSLRQYDNGDIVEDREVQTTGSYLATAAQTLAVDYIIQLVAFKAAP